MKTPKVDTSGTERANLAIAQAQEAASNLQKNFKADLTTENLTQIAPGGSAADAAAMQPDSTRRRRQGSGLASQLGINY
ncbi:MAG TPA: hypothetical protein VM783_17880 [Candidatus Acidoferrum sp.]|nr:hypothetical protein [Candidatus Acidoferrum sp.]